MTKVTDGYAIGKMKHSVLNDSYYQLVSNLSIYVSREVQVFDRFFLTTSYCIQSVTEMVK